jgi:LacI family transcriptional regulator
MKNSVGSSKNGIREIAKAVGLSIGTVDRALNGRPGVRESTRERVLAVAKKVNYTPNLAARNLVLGRRLSIGVFLPQEIASHFDLVREGIRAAAATVGPAFDVEVHDFLKVGEGDISALKSADWERYAGIILSPGNGTSLGSFWPLATKAQKPIVLVTTDVLHASRIASVSVDAGVCGGIAADLLGSHVPRRSGVLFITGDLKVQEHNEKLRGFAASLAQLAPHLTLLPAVEDRDDFENAYKLTKRMLKQEPALRGIYVSTANSLPVLQALEELGQLGNVKVVGTDLFPEIIPHIEAGHLVATLEQRPFTQGRRSFEILASYLRGGEVSNRRTRLAPHIVLRGNLPHFLERLNIV